jgi:transposase-like protein
MPKIALDTIITSEILAGFDKCPFCGAEKTGGGNEGARFDCGTFQIRGRKQSEYRAARCIEISETTLRARVKELEKGMPINTSERLLDLVRYSRASLHEDGLVTDGEYAWLCGVGSQSARRLEEYDTLRARVKELVWAGDKMAKIVGQKGDPALWVEETECDEAVEGWNRAKKETK